MLHSPPLQVGIVALWLLVVGLIALGCQRSQLGGPEVVRKIVHIGTGNIIVLVWWLHVPAWIGVGASLLFSIITLASYWLPILPMINSVGRQSWGTFFYSISIGILMFVFWPLEVPQYAVIGVLVMTWGDGMAALIGQRWGRHSFQVWGTTKSLEGCCAMAIASFTLTSLVLLGCQGPVMSTWGVAVAIALIATSLELFSRFGIDNLTVPLGSGAIAFGLNHIWLGF